jgi:hypothetical protein
MEPGAGLELLAEVGDRVLIPIDVRGGQAGRVGLRGARVPKEFVEVAPLGVLLAGDDGGMLGAGDGALLFEHRTGPLKARDDGLEQPLHAQGVIVDAAEVNVGGDFTIRQGAVEMLRSGLGDREVAEAGEVLVLDRDFPAAAGFTGLLGDDIFHHLLPGARAEFGVGTVDVHAGQRQVEVGLALAFVVGVEEVLGLGPVAGLETGLVASGFVFEVVNAPRAFNQTERLLHRFTHGCECEAVGTFSIREQWEYSLRTVSEYWANGETGGDSGETLTLFRS